jgi:hypothetical protein
MTGFDSEMYFCANRKKGEPDATPTRDTQFEDSIEEHPCGAHKGHPSWMYNSRKEQRRRLLKRAMNATIWDSSHSGFCTL